ncbi:MAG: M28 family peptidase [Coriobacteriia bacterium]|nr:M28 family peptidase [Coriobacteriia bacterium]
MSQVMEHVNQLADTIGPRPATTDAEAQAAEYIEAVFGSRALEVERQEFECPRTDAWAGIVHGVLLLGAAVLSIWWSLPALALAVVAVVLIWLELGMRFSVGRFFGRGPSQNIIARHVPRARRNERLKRVVIVAHYDTARPSFLTSPGFVRHLGLLAVLTKWVPVGVAVWLAFTALPFASDWKPWSGYVAIAGAAIMLVPAAAGLQRMIFSHATDGANDNASGVAAMLAVMEATVPESEESQRRAPVRRGPEAVIEAGELDDDVILEYRPVTPAIDGGQLPIALGDFDELDDTTGWPSSAARATAPVPAEGSLWDAESSEVPPTAGRMPAAGLSGPLDLDDTWGDRAPAAGQSSFALDLPGGVIDEDVSLPTPAQPAEEPYETDGGQAAPAGYEDVPREGRSRSRRERKEGEDEGKGLRDWLGIGRGFDVRRAGKEIGSWENLDHDDDEFGFKAGSAGGEITGAVDSSAIAARIRRQVTDGIDRALAEKEIWFVATGAGEPGGYGMRALLDAYGEDLRDAMIINLDTVGSGAVSFITQEGATKRHRADRRLVSQAKRTARDQDLPVRGRTRTGASSDAVVALASGFRAMSVMAFDINGRLPNWHWQTDTVSAVSADTIEQAATFVSALVRDL